MIIQIDHDEFLDKLESIMLALWKYYKIESNTAFKN